MFIWTVPSWLVLEKNDDMANVPGTPHDQDAAIENHCVPLTSIVVGPVPLQLPSEPVGIGFGVGTGVGEGMDVGCGVGVAAGVGLGVGVGVTRTVGVAVAGAGFRVATGVAVAGAGTGVAEGATRVGEGTPAEAEPNALAVGVGVLAALLARARPEAVTAGLMVELVSVQPPNRRAADSAAAHSCRRFIFVNSVPCLRGYLEHQDREGQLALWVVRAAKDEAEVGLAAVADLAHEARVRGDERRDLGEDLR